VRPNTVFPPCELDDDENVVRVIDDRGEGGRVDQRRFFVFRPDVFDYMRDR
jgi:hypothetical protein